MSDDRWPDRDGRNREDDRSGREREDPRERVRDRESRDARSRPEPSLDRLDDERESVRYRNHDYRLNDADVELLRTVGTFRAADTHMFFRLSSTDAASLAPELSAGERRRYVGELTSLERGEAIVRVGADPPARVRVPRLPALTATGRCEGAALACLSRRRDARDRREIEAGIRARQQARAARVNAPRHERNTDEGQQDW